MKVEWRADDKLLDDSFDFNNLKRNCQWFEIFQFNGIVGVIIINMIRCDLFIIHGYYREVECNALLMNENKFLSLKFVQRISTIPRELV